MSRKLTKAQRRDLTRFEMTGFVASGDGIKTDLERYHWGALNESIDRLRFWAKSCEAKSEHIAVASMLRSKIHEVEHALNGLHSVCHRDSVWDAPNVKAYWAGEAKRAKMESVGIPLAWRSDYLAKLKVAKP